MFQLEINVTVGLWSWIAHSSCPVCLGGFEFVVSCLVWDLLVLIGLLLFVWYCTGWYVRVGLYVLVCHNIGWFVLISLYWWVFYCTGGIGRVGFCWREVRVSLTLYWWNWAGVFVLVRSTFEFVSVRVDLWWCVCVCWRLCKWFYVGLWLRVYIMVCVMSV